MTKEEIEKYEEWIKHFVIARQNNKTSSIDIPVTKFVEILDYIGDLQQENEKLKELCKSLNQLLLCKEKKEELDNQWDEWKERCKCL